MDTLHIRVADFEEYPTALACRMAAAFAIPSPVETYDFTGKGNINRHTYRVTGGSGSAPEEYLLQQINPHVFRNPRSVMAAMIACIEAQRATLPSIDPDVAGPWQPVELIPTRGGEPYLVFEDLRGLSFWRLMRRIPDSRTCKSLGEIENPADRRRTARESGHGLALFADLTAHMDARSLASPLPGYRDTALYFDQLDAVLRGVRTSDECTDLLPDDPVVRESTAAHFRLHLPDEESRRRRNRPDVRHALELVLAHREYALSLRRGLADGSLRTVAIHGDTKLDNFLFDTRTGRVKALVDLDTLMPHTWLTDWGDMVRSLSNVAGEMERNLDRVRVDRDLFKVMADGFLSTANTVHPEETARMVDAARILALELGLRFLTDYLRGDSYFKISAADPGDLNRARALCQLTLFQSIGEHQAELEDFIAAHGPAGNGGM